MINLEAVVGDIVPSLYADRSRRSGRPASSDMSRSDECHLLTRDLWDALRTRGIPARRELHVANGVWHFVIAHNPVDTEPRPDNVITDLNPWRGISDASRTGYLHGLRSEVQDLLLEAGCPEELVALRGVGTITEAHTMQYTYQPNLRQAG